VVTRGSRATRPWCESFTTASSPPHPQVKLYSSAAAIAARRVIDDESATAEVTFAAGLTEGRSLAPQQQPHGGGGLGLASGALAPSSVACGSGGGGAAGGGAAADDASFRAEFWCFASRVHRAAEQIAALASLAADGDAAARAAAGAAGALGGGAERVAAGGGAGGGVVDVERVRQQLAKGWLFEAGLSSDDLLV